MRLDVIRTKSAKPIDKTLWTSYFVKVDFNTPNAENCIAFSKIVYNKNWEVTKIGESSDLDFTGNIGIPGESVTGKEKTEVLRISHDLLLKIWKNNYKNKGVGFEYYYIKANIARMLLLFIENELKINLKELEETSEKIKDDLPPILKDMNMEEMENLFDSLSSPAQTKEEFENQEKFRAKFRGDIENLFKVNGNSNLLLIELSGLKPETTYFFVLLINYIFNYDPLGLTTGVGTCSNLEITHAILLNNSIAKENSRMIGFHCHSKQLALDICNKLCERFKTSPIVIDNITAVKPDGSRLEDISGEILYILMDKNAFFEIPQKYNELEDMTAVDENKLAIEKKNIGIPKRITGIRYRV